MNATAKQSGEFLAAALEYARHGWPVFALKPRSKAPLTEHGFKDATHDPEQIRAWWTRWPDANVGVPTGRPIGAFVLDADCKNGAGGLQTLDRLSVERAICETLQQITGSGGKQLFFRLPGFDVRCFGQDRTGEVGLDGCDIKADGGYVVVPPSIHPDTGRAYEWDGLDPFHKQPILDAPMAVLQPVAQLVDGAQRGSARPIPMVIPEGQRAKLLTSIAGSMRRRGAEYEEICTALVTMNERRCQPPLPATEVEKMAASICKHYAPATGTNSGDCTMQEREEQPSAEHKILAVLDSIRATPAVRLVYENIQLFAKLSEAKLVLAIEELKKLLPDLRRDDFRRAVRDERRRQESVNRPEQDAEYQFKDGRLIRLKHERNRTVEEIRLTEFEARIAADILEDDGVERRRFFGVKAKIGSVERAFLVPANRFNSMEWPLEHLGAAAIVYPNQKEWARTGIQRLSSEIEERVVYSHTGWRKVNGGWMYLHADGAIGPDGRMPGVDVRLHGPLAGHQLTLPEDDEHRRRAVHSSLKMLRLAARGRSSCFHAAT